MKPYLKFLALILLSFFITNCKAQLLEVGAWNTFDGKIGKSKSQLSLYLFQDKTIKGNYVIENDGKKNQLVGHLKANAIFLTEVKNKKLVFRGNTFTDTLDKFEGNRIDTLKNEKLSFNFILSSINWGNYEDRYGIYGNDDEIEGFMEKVKKSILTNDKQWVVNHVHYPTRHLLKKGPISINNKYQLNKYYDQVFTKEFKERIKQAFATNLFNKDGSIMLGNGEIWIGNTANSTNTKYDFIITTINP